MVGHRSNTSFTKAELFHTQFLRLCLAGLVVTPLNLYFCSHTVSNLLSTFSFKEVRDAEYLVVRGECAAIGGEVFSAVK